MMSSPAAARDAYLAWQAEIGGDEVVLATPWARRAPAPAAAGAERSAKAAPFTPRAPARPETAGIMTAPSPQATHPADPAAPGSPGAPALPEVRFEPMKPFVVPGLTDMPGYGTGTSAGPEFFSEIAERLAESARNSARTGASRPRSPSPSAPAATVPVSPLQEALAGLKDLEAYWRFVTAEYPRWFAGTPTVTPAQGHAAPRLAVVELSPSGDTPFAGESGALFDRMMNAIGLSRDQMYLTSLMKSPPSRPARTWARKDTARMVPVLLRELQLAQCGLVLVMGEACAQAVLKTGRPVPDLVKSPVETAGLSLSATWHPDEIRAADAEREKNGGGDVAASPKAPPVKAPRPRATQAWDHLQWLRGLLPAR